MCISNFLSKILVKAVSPLPKFEKMQKFLFVSPHPDDIEIGAGATAAKLCGMGKEVYFVIATNGKLGAKNTSLDSDEIIKIRRQETLNSAELLGVKKVFFLDFDDGGDYTIENLAMELAKLYAKIVPDIVFAPDPHLFTECHLDHIKTGYSAANAVITAGVPMALKNEKLNAVHIKGLAFYYTAQPNYYFPTGNYVKKQLLAMSQYKSQFDGNIQDAKSEFGALGVYVKYRNRINGLLHFKGKADAFRLLSPLMYHCCAEKL